MNHKSSLSKSLTGYTLIAFFGSVALPGCSRQPTADFQQATNDRLERNLLGYRQVDAIQYFEGGGKYVDFDGDPLFDFPYVLPLLRRLEDEFEFDWIVLIPPQETTARELIARIPIGFSKSAIQSRLVKLQEDFPGSILQEWGTDYLSLDFLNVEESEYMN